MQAFLRKSLLVSGLALGAALIGGNAGGLLVEALLAGEGDDLGLELTGLGGLGGALVRLD